MSIQGCAKYEQYIPSVLVTTVGASALGLSFAILDKVLSSDTKIEKLAFAAGFFTLGIGCCVAGGCNIRRIYLRSISASHSNYIV